jgi:hypothetical protein
MTTILKNTTIAGTGYITPPVGSTSTRPPATTTIIQWTNTGSQAYSVLAGTTPTLTNIAWTAPIGVTSVELLVVAGGGGGASGGGGAGGLIYNPAFAVTPGNSYTVTVGTGGAAGLCDSALTPANQAVIGNNSVFGSLTAIGGGRGASTAGTGGSAYQQGGAGGSGGGAAADSAGTNFGGAGTAGQGNDGGGNGALQSSPYGVGGGGGAGFPGTTSRKTTAAGGGGNGLNFSIGGTPTWYAGGGGGGAYTTNTPGAGGLGGGGAGNTNAGNGTAGTASTGGGGGGAGGGRTGGAGGSGIVIIRYTVSNITYDLAGSLRYNTDLRGIEVYKDVTSSWVSQDPARNFAGHNLLTYSEQFNNAAWSTPAAPVAATISTNSILAPDGTLTADTVNYSTTTAHPCYQQATFAIPSGISITSSLYVKQSVGTAFALQCCIFNGAGVLQDGYANITFDGSGVASVAASNAYMTVSSTSVGGGWYRIQATNNNQAGSAGTYVRFSIGQRSQIGSIYVWGGQLEQSATPGSYARTIDVASPVPTNIGGWRTHTYTTTGTSGFSPAATGVVEVLVVAGGGGGGPGEGGGAGAGGLIYNTSYAVVANQQYTVTVGAGGATSTNGSNSVFGPLTAIGGGFGGSVNNNNAGNGGSGGGGGRTSSVWTYGGMGVVGQGNAGGTGNPNLANYPAGGGGGAGSPGGDGVGAGTKSGPGGDGLQLAISGMPIWYAGGGGGAASTSNTLIAGNGGLGGGGAGGTSAAAGNNGTANTGGGGGGAGQGSATGGTGGSGIVIVRYRYD